MHNARMKAPLSPSPLPIRALVLAGVLGAWGLASAQPVGTPQQPLRLLYQERPPYTTLGPGGRMEGLLVGPLQQALERAGLSYRWEQFPSQRQLLLVQTGEAPVCGVGWFRNAERDKLGRYSRPLYRDLPMGGVTRADVALPEASSLQAVLAEGRWSLLTKEGFSYGAQVDRWLENPAVRRVSTGNEPAQLVRMLLARRADWMLVAPEEARMLLAQHPPGTLRMLRFTDVGPGLERHLYCNRTVSAELMQRIDEGLARVPPSR
jgi:polar amino acid transport system substrate-binding protein